MDQERRIVETAGPPFENSSRAITRMSGVFSASLHTRARNANTLNVITFIKLHRALLRDSRGIFRACFTTKMEAWLDPIQPGARIHPYMRRYRLVNSPSPPRDVPARFFGCPLENSTFIVSPRERGKPNRGYRYYLSDRNDRKSVSRA